MVVQTMGAESAREEWLARTFVSGLTERFRRDLPVLARPHRMLAGPVPISQGDTEDLRVFPA
jgi:hypothetical protein